MILKDVKPGQRFRLKGGTARHEQEMIMGALHPSLDIVEVPFGTAREYARVMTAVKTGVVYVASDDHREVILSAGSSAELEQRASTPPVGGSSPSPYASTTHDELVYHIGLDGKQYNGATVFFRRPKGSFDLWDVGVAFCHADDEFVPKVGERLARHRAIGQLGDGSLDLQLVRAFPSWAAANEVVNSARAYLLL